MMPSARQSTVSTTRQPRLLDRYRWSVPDRAIRAEGFYRNALAATRDGRDYAAIRYDLRALQADGSHEAARQHLESLREKLAPQVGSLIESGRVAFRAEDLEQALQLWRQALLVSPGNERAAAYIGRAERQLANLERVRSEPEEED